MTTRERADALAADGRWREAIELLNSTNRQQPDAEIEARIVELRRDATRPSGSRGPKRWPPRARNRFRHGHGIPEIAAEQLNARVLRSAIAHQGCLLVRGLVHEPRISQLIDDIDHTFDTYDVSAPTASAPWFVPYDPGPDGEVPREWIRNGDGVVAVDSPRALFDAIEAFDEVGIRELVTDFLGEPPLLLGNKWTLRRVAPGPDGTLDFHQDGAFLGAGVRLVNVWLSLSTCGVDAPGLELVARRFSSVVGVGRDDASLDWTLSEDNVRQMAAAEIVRPVFEPGDALIFDHLLVHRTAYDPSMTRTRYAIEAWFAAPSAAPANALPIAY